jgi:NADH-quinone oxidoreductase subunit B
METKLATTTHTARFFEWTRQWSQARLLWSFPVGTACCDPVMNHAHNLDPDNYIDPFPFYDKASGCDLLIVSGTLTRKFAPYLLELYTNLTEPRWVMAIGACAISGGPYQTYSTLNGLEELFPVDVYVPGCPPDARSIYQGVLTLKEKVQNKPEISLS